MLGVALAQMGGDTKPCDACGMTLDTTGQNRYQITDNAGYRYYACCPGCAFKLIKTYGELNITSFCDYKGPSAPITIIAKNHGSVITVNPTTAIMILGGSCSKNRLVYDSQAADALLAAPNSGTSQWLSPMQNATVASNATRLSIAQAILQNGGGESIQCEACGMTVDVNNQARCRIFDSTGTLHIACCPVCALKLLKTYGALNYTAICDYNGPSQTISIVARNYGADVTVTPSTALIILGGGCTKNRLVADSASADALLASPNNGTSPWLYGMTNSTVASNATRLDVVNAALKYGEGPAATPTPTPTAAPTPTPTASATSKPTQSPKPTNTPTNNPSSTPTLNTETCEACGMDATAEAQTKYQVVDGDGQIHFAECIMCALQLTNQYEKLTITTYCDWYGPNYPIIIQSTNFGKDVTVSPTTALFLDGGSCAANRAAYNQTAADELLTNGYSIYTMSDQRYSLPAETNVTPMATAVMVFAEQMTISPSQFPIVIVAVAGIAIVAISVVVFMKLKVKKT